MACEGCYYRVLYGVQDVADLPFIRAAWVAYRGGAKARGHPWALTKRGFIDLWRKPCAYCGHAIDTIGIDRIDNAQGYLPGNVNPCCWPCNSSKGAMPLAAWLEHAQRVIAHCRAHPPHRGLK